MKLLILLLCPAIIFAYTYLPEFDYENIFVPCEDKPELFVTTFMDYSNVTFHTFDNNTLNIKGILEIVKELTDSVGLKIEVLKKQRGVFVNTVFSISRPDLCKSLFDPVEKWYPTVKDIPEDQRICPLQKGMKFNLDLFTNLEFNLIDKTSEGYYKLQVQHFYKKSKKVITCYCIFANLYRI